MPFITATCGLDLRNIRVSDDAIFGIRRQLNLSVDSASQYCCGKWKIQGLVPDAVKSTVGVNCQHTLKDCDQDDMENRSTTTVTSQCCHMMTELQAPPLSPCVSETRQGGPRRVFRGDGHSNDPREHVASNLYGCCVGEGMADCWFFDWTRRMSCAIRQRHYPLSVTHES